MRKTITGTGGMLLLQTSRTRGSNTSSRIPAPRRRASRGAGRAEEHRLVVGKHEGLVAAMADGHHRISGKVGVVIAHVRAGSLSLAGQLFKRSACRARRWSSSPGDWASELQDFSRPRPAPRP